MTKDMKIVGNCDPGTEYYSKGFKPQMLAPAEDIVNKLHIERWYVSSNVRITIIIVKLPLMDTSTTPSLH